VANPWQPATVRRMDGPRREVHQEEALAWLRARAPLVGASVVTSLPDVSELPALSFEAWTAWFEQAAALVLESVPDDGVAIFFQSDIRHAGLWVDKGALVTRAAERTGAGLLFHRIVCRKPPGTMTFGRATYAHLLGFSRRQRPSGARADVLGDGGPVAGRKAMGATAALEACRFIREETASTVVVDPFCGWGTVLAAANQVGLDAIGVDLSARMCRRARGLQWAALLAGASPAERALP
jgi:hypothetical protein